MYQFLPRALLKYFPIGLGLMVIGIYCMFVVLVYILESKCTPMPPLRGNFRHILCWMRHDLHLDTVLVPLPHCSIRPWLRFKGCTDRQRYTSQT
jgi:hypothetical protein